MSGLVGDAVFSNEQDGVGMRSHNPMSKQPFTPAQLAREAAFKKANQTWTTLSLTVANNWRAWGRTQSVRSPISGRYRTRDGKDCFVGLYAKMLQMNAASALPTIPVGTYAGDANGVTLSVVAGSGVATWTASAANSAGTTTELLYQLLPSPVALARPDEYHSAKFQAFAGTGLTTTTTLAPGSYAFAYQFVELSTGRVAGFVPLGTSKVTLALVEGGADEAAGEMAQAA